MAPWEYLTSGIHAVVDEDVVVEACSLHREVPQRASRLASSQENPDGGEECQLAPYANAPEEPFVEPAGVQEAREEGDDGHLGEAE